MTEENIESNEEAVVPTKIIIYQLVSADDKNKKLAIYSDGTIYISGYTTEEASDLFWQYVMEKVQSAPLNQILTKMTDEMNARAIDLLNANNDLIMQRRALMNYLNRTHEISLVKKDGGYIVNGTLKEI